MPDLVSEHFGGEFIELLIAHLTQANDDCVIDESDHRKAAEQLFALLLLNGEAPLWLGELDEPAPERQGPGPGAAPLVLKVAQLIRHDCPARSGRGDG